jgi:hypothetical protein
MLSFGHPAQPSRQSLLIPQNSSFAARTLESRLSPPASPTSKTLPMFSSNPSSFMVTCHSAVQLEYLKTRYAQARNAMCEAFSN